MLFSSLSFLYYFLPIVLLVYFVVPKKCKNIVLFLSSLFFYGCGEPNYIFVMLINILLNYILGLLIDKYRNKNIVSKCFLGLSVLFNVGMLGYFKYANFFIENFSSLTGISIKLLNVTLPIGISFYTFQILSYIIDVYRKKVPVQKNPLILGTYIVFFPQLIAGPIVRYSEIENQLKERVHSFDKVLVGIQRFVLGLGKKVLIANVLGELCLSFQITSESSVLFYWLYAVACTLQIYFDFSGYSDMAIGLGKIFGFDFCENFNYPFISKSISEFWRRWHISLGSWFKDYVYIPMGGSRCSKTRLLFNILTVWFLTGFWHGAEWNFIIWGLYFAFFLLVEKYFMLNYLNKTKVLNHLYVCFFILISFVIFNVSDLNVLGEYLKNMFGFGGLPLISKEFIYQLRNYWFVLCFAIIFSIPLFPNIKKMILRYNWVKITYNLLETPCLLIILIVCTAYLVDGSFNPFLYFRF